MSDSSQRRSFTDGSALKICLIIHAILFGLIGLAALSIRSSSYKASRTPISEYINSTVTNDTASNSTVMRDAYDAFRWFIDDTADGKSPEHLFIIGALTIVSGLFFWNIVPADLNSQDTHHYTIIFVVKLIVTSTILLPLFTSNNYARYPRVYVNTLMGAEGIIIGRLIGKNYEEEDNSVQTEYRSYDEALRFYIRHWSIIFYQCLNYSVIALLVAYVAMHLYKICPIYSYPLIMMVISSAIYVIYLHGQMVIIHATATNCLEQNEKIVSVMTILSSMITISRYHLGTVMTYTMLNHRTSQQSLLTESGDFTITNRGCINKHLVMFTAIYGQDIKTAEKSMLYFEKKKLLVQPNFKNKIFKAWAMLFFESVSVLFVSFPFKLIGTTVQDGIDAAPLITYYAAITTAYFLIFVNSMNTVENTMEFCKVIKTQDIEAMRAELSEEGEGLEQAIVARDANRIDEN